MHRPIMSGTLPWVRSLSTLVSHPALYGWNWTYELRSAYGGISNIPEHRVRRLLARDRDVVASSGVDFAEVQLERKTVQRLGVSTNARVSPPTLSGHGVTGPNEIVLGDVTLA